ncbi:MAG: NAD(P)/FAD-dependent oxidoreductase [Terrimicrobiaceae bacterium]
MKRAITIAGGGLAGLSLGIALRHRGVPVDLHEAGSYPRHRVCGEFISGVRPAVLESLGIADLLVGAEKQRTTAWFYGGEKIFAAALPVSARGISRHVLDDAMRRRFQELGGALHERSRQQPEDREGLVWCAGRIPARGEWIGLKCHVHNMPLKADLEMHLGRNGYAGLARVGSDTVNVCGLFRLDKTLDGTGLLQKHLRRGGLSSLADRMEAAGVDESSLAAVAGFRLGWQRSRPEMMTLGDACGMIPPFTGNGMSMAFESAALAVTPLLRYATGAEDWKNTGKTLRGQLQRKFSLRLICAQAMHPFLTRPRGQAFLAAVTRSKLLPFNFCFHALR